MKEYISFEEFFEFFQTIFSRFLKISWVSWEEGVDSIFQISHRWDEWFSPVLRSTGFETLNWIHVLFVLMGSFCFIVLPSATLIAFLDRKLSADLQARVGPNRAGIFGVLQPVADFLKLLQKENLFSSRVQKDWRETVWLLVHHMALYSTLGIIPLGTSVLLVDTEMSVFLPFWSALVLGLGAMLLGLSQGSVPGWFGGIRLAAQTLAGFFPALVSLLSVGVYTGSFRWSSLANIQGFLPWGWTLFVNPFEFLAFFIFVMSGLVLLAIAPLDGGLSVSDIHGGVASHLSGSRLSLFRFGRFYGFFLWSVITVVLFLGAWRLPQSLEIGLQNFNSIYILCFLQLLVLLSKTFFLMLFIIWVARVNVRSRVDQITDFGWKVLSPFALFALLGNTIWFGWRKFF